MYPVAVRLNAHASIVQICLYYSCAEFKGTSTGNNAQYKQLPFLPTEALCLHVVSSFMYVYYLLLA